MRTTLTVETDRAHADAAVDIAKGSGNSGFRGDYGGGAGRQE
jgi:hypothetical protein